MAGTNDPDDSGAPPGSAEQSGLSGDSADPPPENSSRSRGGGSSEARNGGSSEARNGGSSEARGTTKRPATAKDRHQKRKQRPKTKPPKTKAPKATPLLERRKKKGPHAKGGLPHGRSPTKGGARTKGGASATGRSSTKGRTPPAKRRLPAGRAEGRRHVVFAGMSLLAVFATAFVLLVFGYGRLRGPGSNTVEIDWPADLDPEQAAAFLEDRGLVRSASATALYFRTAGGTEAFVPGAHILPRDASPHDLHSMLTRSASRPSVRVVIPEGFHRFDIAARLHRFAITGQKAFVAASADPTLLAELGIDKTQSDASTPIQNQERTTAPPDSAEGYLFPATYDFLTDTDAREVVRTLVAEADKRWAALLEKRREGLSAAAGSLGWGRREIVTLASIIQREAVMDDERPLVASVFYNRLLDSNFKPRRRLQSDPTAMYGCVANPTLAPTCANYNGKPTSAILHDPKNPYTTYMAPGLPPGPICNPGLASLEAALAPAATKYLFFVAKGGGRHTFSETFSAHNSAIPRRD